MNKRAMIEAALRLEHRVLEANRERFRRGLDDNPYLRWLCSPAWTRPTPGYQRGSVRWKGIPSVLHVTAVAGEISDAL